VGEVAQQPTAGIAGRTRKPRDLLPNRHAAQAYCHLPQAIAPAPGDR
jgi:hypothetical protein